MWRAIITLTLFLLQSLLECLSISCFFRILTERRKLFCQMSYSPHQGIVRRFLHVHSRKNG